MYEQVTNELSALFVFRSTHYRRWCISAPLHGHALHDEAIAKMKIFVIASIGKVHPLFAKVVLTCPLVRENP